MACAMQLKVLWFRIICSFIFLVHFRKIPYFTGSALYCMQAGPQRKGPLGTKCRDLNLGPMPCIKRACWLHHRVHTEWQWFLAGVDPSWWKNPPSLVRVGGGCMLTPFHYLPSRTKLCMVYALAERADTLPLFLLYPYMYSVGCTSPCLFFLWFGGSCHSFYLFCLLQSHTFIITLIKYTHPSPFTEASLLSHCS